VSDELEVMRLRVAQAHGFDPYLTYTEKQVAGFLKKDLTTLKRWRKKAYIAFDRQGPKLISYLGSDVADFLLGKRSSEWQSTPSENSKSENIGSPRKANAPHGAGPGSTRMPDRPDAFLLAQTILKKPNGS
jgi:hypothetical protein